MTSLDPESIGAIDRSSMLDDVIAQPGQLADALWRVESAALAPREAPDGLVVCGMGGSAIGGDLARACVGGRARAPIHVVRDYDPGPWLRADTLVLCATYSGDTEETLACYEAAREAGAPRVALTTGGRLAELAREDGAPVIGVPAGMQPRAAVAYMTVAALECAAACGAAPSLREEIEAAAAPLERVAAEWGPDGPDESAAKALARSLAGGVPVVHGAGSTVAPARRWKTQLNENAKSPAFFSALPEADHNEICGFRAAAGSALGLRAVLLADPGHPDRLARRIEHTAKAAERDGVVAHVVEAAGHSAVERVMSLVLLGDLVSVYTAVLRDVDPTPVEAIESFKLALSQT